jgi:hypothetical protein
MTHHTTPTMLEVLSYLTDSTFMSATAVIFAAFIALEAINRIGDRR